MFERGVAFVTDRVASFKGSIITLAVWLALVAFLNPGNPLVPQLAELYDNEATNSIPESAESQAATSLLLEKFPDSRRVSGLLVFHNPAGLTADDRARIQEVSVWLGSDAAPELIHSVLSVFTTPAAEAQLVSEDGTTMTMLVNFSGAPVDDALLEAVGAIRGHLAEVTEDSPLEAYVTGLAGFTADLSAIFVSTDVVLLLATVSLVLILLIVLYRVPLLAFIPLVVVIWVLQIANSALGFLVDGGLFATNQQATSIVTVLLFGAGTDYTIFIVSRFKEELRRTEDRFAAMRVTMQALATPITSSAVTLILAVLALLIAGLGLYASLGPTLATAMTVMLFAGLTLVPAVLVMMGRSAYWPFIPPYNPGPRTVTVEDLSGPWGSIAKWVSGHRRIAVGSSTALLAVLALGSIPSVTSYGLLEAFREPTDATRGFEVLRRAFPPGTLAPTVVVLEFLDPAAHGEQHLAAIDSITESLSARPEVAQVRGPTRPSGDPPPIPAAELQQAFAVLPDPVKEAIRVGDPAEGQSPAGGPVDPELAAVAGLYAASRTSISADGSTVQLSVILNLEPSGLDAIDFIPTLREDVRRAVESSGLASETEVRALVGGQTSFLYDTSLVNQRDSLIIIPLVLLLIGTVLGLLLRSPVAALYLMAAVALNFAATLGISAFVFQQVLGHPGFNYAIPLYTFIFLVGLGVDYSVFLMTRVREESTNRGLEAGVPIAVARTGGVITSAGIILAGTFAVLTSLPLNILFQLGFAVAVGLLLDTFVVRGFLVPGLILMLGRRTWGGRVSIRPPRSGASLIRCSSLE